MLSQSEVRAPVDRGSGYRQGVKLGVDVGLVRVGLASCDAQGTLATPVKTLKRDVKKNSDVRVIVREAEERGAVQIFVGLPQTLKGGETASARMAREYALLLVQQLEGASARVEVRLIDERLSTVSAHRSLYEAGVSGRKHRKVVDQAAAVGILQHAIDMQRSLSMDVGVVVSTGEAGHSTGPTDPMAEEPDSPMHPVRREGDDQ
ncbi:MAG TPA: Holliday junction resolvase RuvX [Arthrobacter sp.]|nr:Holliday junction resolvase RuvX [Arthrobacter sp.]